ncbi:serine/threonine-protein kinase [Sandaracinus amylolyticus]|uniref:Adenylate cyclase n=1 Tax=Sandaracinus amylolyticus TaxID=927083 RepID=A0A0F6W1R4_9BACT|nr:serine/threonine-protein kinase [Sandaracinus amylolyticus]AKF05040.1 Adenylate cyclase [Sandaracinus amylolyticus]
MSAVGRRIDRYVIEAELDAGGFGQVFRARHGVTGRAVALKLLHPSREASLDVVERFLREARILSAISSPHVVQVLDAGISDDRKIFLAMELLEGESLAKRIQRAGPLPMRDAITVARQMLAGLSAAHAAGVVHRDLKPGNVFLARGHDGSETAKVLDFGISKSRARGDESVITMTGAVLGTPHYMAPEQLHGARDVDGRADLYALAVCLYEMLSGRLPYSATTIDGLIAQRLSEPPTPLATHAPHLPRALLTIIDRGLARDPDARFRTPAELDAALTTLEMAALPPTTPPAMLAPSPVSTRPIPGASPYASHRPAPSIGASAVMMPSPISASGARSVGPAPSHAIAAPAAPARNGLLLVMLGGALVVIVLLVLALAGVTAAFVWSRSSAPAPVVVTPAPTPAPPAAVDPIPEDPARWNVPTATPTPAPVAGATRVWVDDVLGDVDGAALDRLAARATPALERCRSGQAQDVVVQIFVNRGGDIPIAQAHPVRPHGDGSTARCVARALRDAGPLDHEDSDGIVTFAAHVAP